MAKQSYRDEILKISPWTSEKAYQKAESKIFSMHTTMKRMFREVNYENKKKIESILSEYPKMPMLGASEEDWKDYLQKCVQLNREIVYVYAYEKYSKNGKITDRDVLMQRFIRRSKIDVAFGSFVLVAGVVLVISCILGIHILP